VTLVETRTTERESQVFAHGNASAQFIEEVLQDGHVDRALFRAGGFLQRKHGKRLPSGAGAGFKLPA
jgi:hypothetical protein